MFLFALICGGAPSWASERFTLDIQDNAIVQRGAPWVVSGTAVNDETFIVEFLGRKADVHPQNGVWSIEFDVPGEYSGPAELIVGTRTLVKKIIVGDVWLCSGQSNMVIPVWKATDGRQIADIAAAKSIHFLQVPNKAEVSQHELRQWKTVSPEKDIWFSAVCLAFGASLNDLTKVPIGLINASVGGTSIESWMSSESVKAVSCANMSKPPQFFDQMIAPLAQPIKGVLWYQGESNRAKVDCYDDLLLALMKDWRTHWRNPSLPFVVMQLPGYGDQPSGLDAGSGWAALRDAQRAVVSSDPLSGLVVTVGLGDGTIHPPRKLPFGQRAAKVAYALAYERQKYTGILPTNFDIKGDAVNVEFNDGHACLESTKDLHGSVYVAGSDRSWYAADVDIKGSSITARSPSVPSPVAIRYAWSDNPKVGLRSCGEGLPLTPFRSDSWPAPLKK